ncbi:ParB/RepB/Spo0J family partition protein [Tateyamaria pelophila]|uniref:ParB/RepB/Spo0J family partition protein n=1 Tax=Tateyamaria pelophila TaxID=328415 RepID=UPI001CBFA830|nr:ParB N-terminal domain-containing protein [Tateyamaria pelophila]
MAKRKRLIPSPTAAAPSATPPARGLEASTLSSSSIGLRARQAPIAAVAGGSAAQAALEEVAHEMANASREGRLLQRIDLDAIDQTYLVRDRSFVDEDEMASLMQSLRARGQQTPIEVVALGGGRFGLISGWRRVVALQRLRIEAQGSDFTTALCFVRAPQTASEAYLAMVEENEIRAGLSFYERARIAARAAEQGAYPTARHAVKILFANASASKRSKIVSFLGIYGALDGVLEFPAGLSERMGLQLSKALEADPGLADRIRTELNNSPAPDAAGEQDVLADILKPETGLQTAPATDKPTSVRPATDKPSTDKPAPEAGIRITRTKGKLVLSGAGVTDALMDALEAWLTEHG